MPTINDIKVRPHIFLAEINDILAKLETFTNWLRKPRQPADFKTVEIILHKMGEDAARAFYVSGFSDLLRIRKWEWSDGAGALFLCERDVMHIVRIPQEYDDYLAEFKKSLSNAKAHYKAMRKDVIAFAEANKSYRKSIKKKEDEDYRRGYDEGIVACLEFKKEKKTLTPAAVRYFMHTKGYETGYRNTVKFVNPLVVGQAMLAVQALFNYMAQSNFNPEKVGRSQLRQAAMDGIEYLKTVLDSGQQKQMLNDLDAVLQAIIRRDVLDEDAVANTLSGLNKEWNKFERDIKGKVLRFLMNIEGRLQKPARQLADRLG